MEKIKVFLKENKMMLAIFAVCVIFFSLSFFYFPKNSGSNQFVKFSAQKGQGAKEIAGNLKNQGIISHALAFRVFVLLSGFSHKLQAGDYSLSPNMSVAKIARKMESGDVIKQELTILEGWDLNDIANEMQSKGILKAVDFIKAAGSPGNFAEKFNFLKNIPQNLNLEGYIFPDTYQLAFSVKPEDIINFALTNLDKKLTPELRQEIKNQGKTIFQIITMASLIEKEVRTPEDKKIVSGILWTRMKIGMPLQLDATITYLTGKSSEKISVSDFQIDSSYNTYKYRGLPLGPICNPGIDSISAAIYPTASDYLFYLSTPAGKTIFSRTLEEHNIAKAKYLR